MTAKEFLAEKGVFCLDTKKRYNEVIAWMEEYAESRKMSGSISVAIEIILQPKYMNEVFTWKEVHDAINKVTER